MWLDQHWIFIENNVSCLENVEKIFSDQIQSYIKLFVLLYGDDTILLDESQFKEKKAFFFLETDNQTELSM